MSNIAIWIAVAVPVAVALEPWAALLHGKVWHGLLWPIHRTHHRRDVASGDPPSRWEANDLLPLLHAPPAVALILYGSLGEPGPWREVAFGAGLGMSAFGLAYVVVHDGLVHERLPVGWLAAIPYLARVRAAHRVHHLAGGQAPYGLFWGPWALRRARRRRRAQERTAAAIPASQRISRTGPSRRTTSP